MCSFKFFDEKKIVLHLCFTNFKCFNKQGYSQSSKWVQIFIHYIQNYQNLSCISENCGSCSEGFSTNHNVLSRCNVFLTIFTVIHHICLWKFTKVYICFYKISYVFTLFSMQVLDRLSQACQQQLASTNDHCWAIVRERE